MCTVFSIKAGKSEVSESRSTHTLTVAMGSPLLQEEDQEPRYTVKLDSGIMSRMLSSFVRGLPIDF